MEFFTRSELININQAKELIITLKSGAKYLYTGTFQYKLHEKGKWSYMDSYSSNLEYINSMYSLSQIKSIETLHNDSNRNKVFNHD